MAVTCHTDKCLGKKKNNTELIEIQSENIKDHQNSYDNSLQLKIKYEESEHKVGCFQSNKATTCYQTKGTYFAKSGHIMQMDYSIPHDTGKSVHVYVCT